MLIESRGRRTNCGPVIVPVRINRPQVPLGDNWNGPFPEESSPTADENSQRTTAPLGWSITSTDCPSGVNCAAPEAESCCKTSPVLAFHIARREDRETVATRGLRGETAFHGTVPRTPRLHSVMKVPSSASQTSTVCLYLSGPSYTTLNVTSSLSESENIGSSCCVIGVMGQCDHSTFSTGHFRL